MSVVGGFDSGSGTKRWKCNHCNGDYNGSYSRVRAHLLGFNGLGVRPCLAVDSSSRETFRILDENRLARKLMKKTISSRGKTSNKVLLLDNLSRSMRNLATENVDDTVARFLYGVGLNLDVVDSSYFREMVKALGSIGPQYELPSMEQLCGSLLRNEKVRLEKVLAMARESWPYTGCTILCANRLDGSLGCFCVNFFVASPRGVMFLKEVDIIKGDGPDSQFINELATAITEVGPSNVIQVITRLGGQASEAFESVILSKFPHIFWSHCTSHCILLLMEEIAEKLHWFKSVVSCCREIEQCILAFQTSSYCTNTNILKDFSDVVSQKFAPSYFLVRRILESKVTLCQVVVSEEWKRWRLLNNASEAGFNAEAVVSRDEFWINSQMMLEVYEPFVRLLDAFDVDKSIMGDVYNWRIFSLEALKCKGNIDDILLNDLESLIEKRWDKLFSPLHGVAYMLHPRYFGERQIKDKTLMRAWNATIERYEADIEERRVLREELGGYWRMKGSFGESDAIECRDMMEPVSWWENFGFETPHLQSLAIKILSQIPSSAILCQESWQCDNMSCKEAVQSFGLGAEGAKDFVFVRNNLRLQSLRNRKMASQSGSGNEIFCPRA